MARRQKWLTPAIVITLLGAIAHIFGVIPGIIPYFQQSEIHYSTNEVTGYPVPYHDGKPMPGDIQSDVLAAGLIKTLVVEVWTEGETGGDATVRIPYSKDDKVISGWMIESITPSKVYMLRLENKLPTLMVGDKVTFYLNLGNVNSDLARRIQVIDREKRLATHYQYVAVPYVSGDIAFIVPVRKSWIYTFGLAVIAILLAGVFWMRRRKQSVIVAGTKIQPDAAEQRPTSSPGSTAPDHRRRDRPPSDGTTGGG